MGGRAGEFPSLYTSCPLGVFGRGAQWYFREYGKLKFLRVCSMCIFFFFFFQPTHRLPMVVSVLMGVSHLSAAARYSFGLCANQRRVGGVARTCQWQQFWHTCYVLQWLALAYVWVGSVQVEGKRNVHILLCQCCSNVPNSLLEKRTAHLSVENHFCLKYIYVRNLHLLKLKTKKSFVFFKLQENQECSNSIYHCIFVLEIYEVFDGDAHVQLSWKLVKKTLLLSEHWSAVFQQNHKLFPQTTNEIVIHEIIWILFIKCIFACF